MEAVVQSLGGLVLPLRQRAVGLSAPPNAGGQQIVRIWASPYYHWFCWVWLAMLGISAVPVYFLTGACN